MAAMWDIVSSNERIGQRHDEGVALWCQNSLRYWPPTGFEILFRYRHVRAGRSDHRRERKTEKSKSPIVSTAESFYLRSICALFVCLA
jgi:hypothetical protein